MKITKKDKIKYIKKAIEFMDEIEFMCLAVDRAMEHYGIETMNISSTDLLNMFPELDKFRPKGVIKGESFFDYSFPGEPAFREKRTNILKQVLKDLTDSK